MRFSIARRPWSLLVILGCICFSPGCGQKNNTPASTTATPETRAAIQAALIEDAGIEKQVLEILARSDAPPAINELEAQSLTLSLLLYAPGQLDESPEKLRQEIEFIPETPSNPRRLLETLIKNQVGEKYSIISSKEIQGFTCNIDGDQAIGNVKFRFPDLFVANVQYRAEQKDGKWRITEFKLPYHDIKLIRNEQQRWVASGLGVERLLVRLPQVAASPVRDFQAPRLRVKLGLKPGIDKPSVAADIVVYEGKKVTPLPEYYFKSFPAAIQAVEKDQQTSADQIALVLWVDRRMPFGPVEQFLYAAAGLGIKDFRFVVESKTPLGEQNGLFSLGEFRLDVPRPFDKDLPPLGDYPRVLLRIMAAADGKSRNMIFMDRETLVSELQAHARSIASSDLKNEPLQIQADPQLRFGELLQILSTLGELKESAKPKIKTFAPLFKVVQLAAPTREEKLDLTIEPKMIDDRESIFSPNVTLEADVNVAPTIAAPDGFADPLSNLKSDPKALELKIEGSSSGGSLSGGRGIGTGSGFGKKPAPNEPKKSP